MSVLSRDDKQKIHQAALSILEETGIKVESPEVLDMLAKAGAKVDQGSQRAWLDERLVSAALATVPKKVAICSRGGVDFSIPDDRVQLISPDGQPPAVLDLEQGGKRPSTLKDLKDLVVLADALPEVDYIWPPVVATDMPSDRSTYYEFLVALAYSSKHIQHGATSPEEARFQVEVCAEVVGGRDELARRPIMSDVCTPISPLRYDKGEAEALVVLARASVPLVHLSMAIAGSATPVTLAGSMAVIAAENLSGITMSQIAKPGAPGLYSSFSGPTDLRTGVFLCGAPEGILLDSAAVEMARYYGLPSCAGGPSNSSRSLLTESGYQSGMTAMASILVGADMIVGLGGMDRAAMISPEKMIMDCEAWRWLERLRAGIEIDDDRLALEAIKRQGPGGLFLSDPHTRKFMRQDLMVPQITAHHPQTLTKPSEDELLMYAMRKRKEILASHKPQLLSGEVTGKIDEIAKRHGIVLPGGGRIFEHA